MNNLVKYIVLVIVFSAFRTSSTAQVFNKEWQWGNGISSQWNATQGSDWRNAQNMTIDERGNVYTLSLVYFNNIKIKPFNEVQIDTMGQSGRDLILTKYNCAGDLVWWKTVATKYKNSMGSILNSGNEALNGGTPTEGNIITDNQGNLFFSFYHARNDTILILDSVYYHNDVVDVNWKLAKVDTNGVLLDMATFSRSDSINIFITDWDVSDDGDIYCGAQTLSDSNTPSTYGDIIPGYRYSIGKLNKSTMDFQWIRRFSDLDLIYGFIIKDIAIDHDKNIIIGGHVSDSLSIFGEDYYIDNSSFGSEKYKEAFIAKFDTIGNLLWYNRASQATPNFLDTSSFIVRNSLSFDDENNVYASVFGARVYFNGVTPNDETGFTVTANLFKLNASTGIAEWILYAEKAGSDDRWNPATTHYSNGILYCGGYHGGAKIDSTIFDATAGAFDPLLVAVDPSNGKLLEWLPIPTGGGNYSLVRDITSDEKGNLFLSINHSGPIELTGLDTLNELHTGRPTGLIVKYGEADCVCTPPSVDLEILAVDTANLEVTFNATAADYESLTWNFGDGTQWLDTSITSFNYTFVEDTAYQICVTANSDGCGMASECLTINLYIDPSDTSIIDTTIIDTTIIDAIIDINSGNWGISIYPNPTKEKVFIDFSGELLSGTKEVFIYDIRGLLQAQTSIKAKEKRAQIDLTHLTPGMYIIRVDNGAHQYAGKLIKQE